MVAHLLSACTHTHSIHTHTVHTHTQHTHTPRALAPPHGSQGDPVFRFWVYTTRTVVLSMMSR
jgi:hypothetical protein